MQRDGKTNPLTGRRKTLLWDMKKEAAPGREHALTSNSTDLVFATCIAMRFCWIYFLNLKMIERLL